jgi:type IV secretion system protein VirB10
MPRASVQAGGAATSEGGVAGVRFATQPMPGAPVPPGGTGGMNGRVAIGGGSTIVYDGGRPAGDDKPAGDTAARASLIRNRSAVVAQGEIVPATLETAVNSTRPGLIRAVVSRDVRGFDGSRLLIPRGSLIGEYRADPQAGKRRILATWTRIIRPDGVAIRIDSPAADPAGGIGMPGKVDSHFLARFANAALQTAFQVGVNLAARADNGAVIVSNVPQMSAGMGQTIVPGADEPPTVAVRPGAAVAVFVARDLDFSGVPAGR